uniref:Uncharacterized protein n=1 Tax=Oryza meridionalis TaxID=40149 RepID=A0A0E0D0Z8_9ORYZ
MLMEELSVFLTNSICKLEISLSNTGDEALLEKAGYDADITIDAIGDKIVFLDSFLSLLIDAHKKPSHFTLNWMAYTCGMVTVAGCSLWLLRHRSMVENHAAHSWHAIKAAAVNFWENCLKHPVAVIAKEISSVSENIKEVSGKQDLFGGDYNMWRKSLYSFFETKNVAMHGIDQSEDAMMTRLNVIFNEHTDTFMDIFSGEVGQAFLIQVQKFFLDGEALFVQVDELIAENRVLLAAFALFLLLLPRFVVGVSTIPWKCIQRRKAEAMAIAPKKRKCSLYEDIKERISRIQELTVLVETIWTLEIVPEFTEFAASQQFLIAEEVGLLIYAIAMLHVQAAQLLGDTGDVMSLQENMRSILRPDSGFEQQMISVDQLDNVMMGRASR